MIDKYLHMIFGLFFGTAWLIIRIGIWGHVYPWEPGVVALAAGVTKEVWDKLRNTQAKLKGLAPEHTVDWRDIAATVVGGMIVVVIATIVSFMVP